MQGGYGKYQGTWISYRRGREFCRQYGVEDVLRPLLEYDVNGDGTGGAGEPRDTPTKEQAMAANRKRFYNTGTQPTDTRLAGPVSNGTYFSNISPTTSVALAAMNKAARLNSPAPRPAAANTARPTSGVMRRPSQQDAFPGGSQQSMVSQTSYTGDDSGYSTQPGANGEPPRKRMRTTDGDDVNNLENGMAPPVLPLDASMRSATPTEPNESFFYNNENGSMTQDEPNGNAITASANTNQSGDPLTLPPLPAPATSAQKEHLNTILDLFASTPPTPSHAHPPTPPNPSSVPAMSLNLPLDVSANNALHWCATLAKIPLLSLLIKQGASIWRGNSSGQSPLVSAVLVNNCWEQSCFPELLELLGPLVEVRDAQGRTVLHHIAVSCGIRGRAASSKYYLECLLEYLVKRTAPPASGSEDSTSNGTATAPSLVRFLSHIVNARDRHGNTALNLVARIGNRSIIQQLLEIHADPALPNWKGVCAQDFGVGVAVAQGDVAVSQQASQHSFAGDTNMTDYANGNNGVVATARASQTQDLSQDILNSATSMLAQTLDSHRELLRMRTEQIDALNASIQLSSSLQQEEHERLKGLKEQLRVRNERKMRITNLHQTVQAQKARQQDAAKDLSSSGMDVEPIWLSDWLARDPRNTWPQPDLSFATSLPPKAELAARLRANAVHNVTLSERVAELEAQAKERELEARYRRVVTLCTGVEESNVESVLGVLVTAVESERGLMGVVGGGGVGRVREFLRRVEGGGEG